MCCSCPGLTSDDFIAFLKKKKRNFDYESHQGFPFLLELDISQNMQLNDIALRRYVRLRQCSQGDARSCPCE